LPTPPSQTETKYCIGEFYNKIAVNANFLFDLCSYIATTSLTSGTASLITLVIPCFSV
jgi:hypothetical protein